MPLHDFASQRLFVPDDLRSGATLTLTREQINYLVNVLRMPSGGRLLVFNGRDGEWAAELTIVSRRAANLTVKEQARAQEGGPDVVYLFAPLKRARLDYLVQKATEMGVAVLQPVITERTQVDRVKFDRMQANIIEAAEQCGVLRVPDLEEPLGLTAALDRLEPDRMLVFCDERAETAGPIAALSALADRPVAVLIGPEGGFSDAERSVLLARPWTLRISLGPRILRADTAAVAALALVNAVVGDWRSPP